MLLRVPRPRVGAALGCQGATLAGGQRGAPARVRLGAGATLSGGRLPSGDRARARLDDLDRRPPGGHRTVSARVAHGRAAGLGRRTARTGWAAMPRGGAGVVAAQPTGTAPRTLAAHRGPGRPLCVGTDPQTQGDGAAAAARVGVPGPARGARPAPRRTPVAVGIQPWRFPAGQYFARWPSNSGDRLGVW